MMKVKLRLTGVCHEQVSTVALAVIVGGPETLHEAASALDALRSPTEGVSERASSSSNCYNH